MYAYLQDRNILSSEQSGFRPNHSAQTALIDVTDHILTGMEDGKVTGIVFLDLQKAFDTVSHDLMLMKLYDLGIRDVELTWFTSYLKERKQAIALQGILSDQKCITIGVPQGSILGPLLFSIYVNDLSNNLTCKTVLYADDTALMYSSDDANDMSENLNNNLSNVGSWLRSNKLSLNVSKTKYMICGTKKRIDQFSNVKLSIDGDDIECVSTFKYLGTWIDPLLKWDDHVLNTCKKISQRIGLVSRLRKCIPVKVTKLLANSLVMPYFDYCNLVWGNCSKELNTKLQVLQNRLARLVLNEGPRAHIFDMFNELNWTTLDKRSNVNLILLVYKCLKGDAPEYLGTKFTYVNTRHAYSTKSSCGRSLYQPKVTSQSGKRTFKYRGAKAWNGLPSNLRLLNCNSNTFKRALCNDMN